MRNIDFQTVHTQTRQAVTVQQQTADQKLKETQQNPESEGPQLHVTKEQEEKARKRKKKKQDQAESPEGNVVKAQTIISSNSNHIDIRI